jgi:hypothetical protein
MSEGYNGENTLPIADYRIAFAKLLLAMKRQRTE